MQNLARLPFERFAGLAALAVGIGGVAYSIAFLVLLYSGAPKAADVLTNVFLLAGGILATAVFTAVYERFRAADPGFALWAFLLGSLGAVGSAAHGGYGLANIVKTPKSLDKELPSATDPRGFATFGLTALAIAIVSVLVLRVGLLPRPLAYLGLVACARSLISPAAATPTARTTATAVHGRPWLCAGAVSSGWSPTQTAATQSAPLPSWISSPLSR